MYTLREVYDWLYKLLTPSQAFGFLSQLGRVKFLSTLAAYYKEIDPVKKLWLLQRLGYHIDIEDPSKLSLILELVFPIFAYEADVMKVWTSIIEKTWKPPQDSHSRIDLESYVLSLFIRNCLLEIHYSPEKLDRQISSYIKNRHVVDLGCGSGFYFLPFERMGCERYVGLDREDVMKIVRPSWGSPGPTLAAFDIKAIPVYKFVGAEVMFLSEVLHGKKDFFSFLLSILTKALSISTMKYFIIHEIPLEKASDYRVPYFNDLSFQLELLCGGRLLSHKELTEAISELTCELNADFSLVTRRTSFVHTAYIIDLKNNA